MALTNSYRFGTVRGYVKDNVIFFLNMVANTSICIMHNFKTNTYLKYDMTAELGITRYSVTLMDQRLVDVKLKASWQSTEVD